jgi:hypothetical protein|tara:strand:+ start:3164 stop:4408 length:1245 start_codon:yes stop_codon:yes gene_type:complete
MKYFKIIKKCRLCKSTNLKKSFDLGSSALCDQYQKTKKKQTFFPLILLMCGDCGLSQISITVSKKYIYKDYIYQTKSSVTLNKHFNSYAKKVKKRLKLNDKDLVIDIGSNSGVLLGYFKKLKLNVLGVEPALKIARNANKNKIPTIAKFFDKKVVDSILLKNKKPKIITINNLFANIDRLDEFVNNLINLIDDKGSIVIETSYLGGIIENHIFDWIYHEHLSYFSIKPLADFFSKKGFRLFDIDKSDSKGSSLRYYFTNKNNNMKISPIIKKLLIVEKNRRYNSILRFKKFKNKIDIQKNKVTKFLLKNNEKNIVGYGASATTTTLLSYFKISKAINYIVDDDPSKYNTYSPGFFIPVKPSLHLNKNIPDIIIVFAWRYHLSIKKKIKKILENLKKKKNILLVTPLPTFKIEKL